MPDHWQPSAETFPTAPISRARYLARLPLQVYSSWNGISILSASALLSPDPIHFRRSKVSQGECAAAEVLLLCKDFWKKGRGKIQVVPGVRVAYERKYAIGARDVSGSAGGVEIGKESWGKNELISWKSR